MLKFDTVIGEVVVSTRACGTGFSGLSQMLLVTGFNEVNDVSKP